MLVHPFPVFALLFIPCGWILWLHTVYTGSHLSLAIGASVSASNVGASMEPDEPAAPSVKSLWVSLITGGFTLDAVGSTEDTVLGIFSFVNSPSSAFVDLFNVSHSFDVIPFLQGLRMHSHVTYSNLPS